MEIRYVDTGIANNFGDFIEINRNLKNYPKLLGPILRHELKHSDKFFTMNDLKIDLNDGTEIDQMQLFKFMIKHPAALTQFAPFYWSRKKGFVYDVNLTLIYAVMGIIIGGGVFLGGAFLW